MPCGQGEKNAGCKQSGSRSSSKTTLACGKGKPVQNHGCEKEKQMPKETECKSYGADDSECSCQLIICQGRRVQKKKQNTEDKYDGMSAEEKLTKVPVIWVLRSADIDWNDEAAGIVYHHHFKYMSDLGLINGEMEAGTPLGVTISEYMSKGELVPTHIVNELFKENMLRKVLKCDGFVIEGIIRNSAQGAEFQSMVKPIDCIIYGSPKEVGIVNTFMEIDYATHVRIGFQNSFIFAAIKKQKIAKKKNNER